MTRAALARLVLLVAIACFATTSVGTYIAFGAEPIDRHALVSRHNVVHRSAAPEHFLQVGNGEFAYAFDVTGMQTLDRVFEKPIPLHTMSNWGWHSFPNTEGVTYDQTLSEFDADGRKVTYADRQNTPAGAYFRANPHRVNLARIGLWWEGQDENGATADDLQDFTEIQQTLDLWTGVATSRFKFRGEPVTVTTVGGGAVAFRIESPLLTAGKLGVVVRFSIPSGEWGPSIDDWSPTDAHWTTVRKDAASQWTLFGRKWDDLQYGVLVVHGSQARCRPAGDHAWQFNWAGTNSAEISFAFPDSSGPGILDGPTPDWYERTLKSSEAEWRRYWMKGGMIDLGGTKDPRARELERRIVLSQYLTAIQNGSLPPQETGLLCNSWFGKQHLEMHWWHAAHFALWGRPEYLEQSLDWYAKILPQARAIAKRQGYAGARWPKMCGPDGISSPSGVGEFLIWQQPHVISLVELIYRGNSTPETAAKYGELVDETARFMADFVEWDVDGRTCHLGPPVIPAQENYKPRETRDPTYELAYWRWALETAQKWRERSGRTRDAEWDRVIAGLARPLIREGRYAAVATAPFTNTSDHPSMLAAFGVLPAGPLIDPAIMRDTARWVDDNWQWEETWGWDFPMTAMTHARCGDPERAVDALLRATTKNTYLPNGHSYQEQRLPVYLPGNGGVLAAAALMAAGWDGGPERNAPGFPADWNVRHEGLLRSP